LVKERLAEIRVRLNPRSKQVISRGKGQEPVYLDDKDQKMFLFAIDDMCVVSTLIGTGPSHDGGLSVGSLYHEGD